MTCGWKVTNVSEINLKASYGDRANSKPPLPAKIR